MSGDLVKRLEEASEGSRELSNDIAEAAGWERNDARSFVWKSPEGFAHHTAPDFSRSLDAALTLIPAGWRVTHAFWGGTHSGFALTKSVGTYAVARIEQHVGSPSQQALALCKASLKASVSANVAEPVSDTTTVR